MKKKATYSAPSMTVVEVETRDIICDSNKSTGTTVTLPGNNIIDLSGDATEDIWTNEDTEK